MTFSAYPPTGTLVDVGGYRLHIRRMGTGQPAVIMDSGLGATSLLFELVLPKIAEFTTAIAFDRAGYAWSEPAPPDVPRTSQQIAKELHTLLRNANVLPPYILAGASFGGINSMVYTEMYPDEVAGLVMLDPSHPAMMDRVPGVPSAKTVRRSAGMMRVLAKVGLMRLLTGTFSKGVYHGWQNLPADVWRMQRAINARSEVYDAWYREAADGVTSFAQGQAAMPALTDVPILVLTGGDMWATPGSQIGRSAQMKKGMLQLRDEMAALSSKGEHRIIQGATHTMTLDQPDAIAAAICEFMNTAQTAL